MKIKKLSCVCLCLIFFLSLFPVSFAETLRYVVVSPTINVRNAISQSADIVYVIKTPGEFLILGESKDNQGKVWYQIKINDTLNGFIASWVVDSIRTTEKETPVTGKIAIIDPGVKIRLTPSLDSEISQLVTETIEKPILSEIKDGENRTWYKILLKNGSFGWVASWVITIKTQTNEKKSATDKLIVAENINIRKGPGMSFDIVAHISTKIEARGIYEANDSDGKVWYLIRLPNNAEGWAASWVVDVKQYSETKKTITGKRAKIEPVVNVRLGPSTQAKIVKTITVVSEYPILSQGNDINGKVWYEIEMEKSLKGWVASWVVEVITEGIRNETIESVIMRNGPGTNFDKVLDLPANTPFTIQGTAFNSNKDMWYAVTISGKTGWILSKLTKVSAKEEIDLSKIGTKIQLESTAIIDIYKGPSTSFPKKGAIEAKSGIGEITGVAKNHTGELWYSAKNTLWEDFWVPAESLIKSTKENKVEPSKISSISWGKKIQGVSLTLTFNDTKIRQYETFSLSKPNRIVIDIKNTLLFQQEFLELINSNGISQLRAAQLSVNPNIVRVVLESSKNLKFTSRNENKTFILDFSDYSSYQGPKLFINGNELENHLVLKESKGHLYVPLYIFSNIVGGFTSWDKDKNEAVMMLNKKEFRFKAETKYVYVSGENQLRVDIQNPIAVLDDVLYIPVIDCKTIFKTSVYSLQNRYYIDNQITSITLSEQAPNLVYTIDFSLPISFEKKEVDKKLICRFNNTTLSPLIKIPANNQLIRAESIMRNEAIHSVSEMTFSLAVLPNYETATIDETNQFVLSFKKSKSKGIKNKKIILDPGHGSFEDGYYDCGAIGPTGLLESFVNLQTALKMKELLEKEGAIVTLTRDQEQNKLTMSLDQRVEFANKSGADLYISIHQNASLSTEAKGCEVFYYNENSEETAEAVVEALSGGTGLLSRGIKKRGLSVTKEITTMPSILIECAFISNPEEEKMLQSDRFIGLISEGIITGVKRFFETAI